MRKLACGHSQLRQLHRDVRSEKLNLSGVTEYKPVTGRKEQKEKGIVSPDSRQQVGGPQVPKPHQKKTRKAQQVQVQRQSTDDGRLPIVGVCC